MIKITKIKSRDNKSLDILCDITKTIWEEYFLKFIPKKEIDKMTHFLQRDILKAEIHSDGCNYYLITNDEETIGYFELHQKEDYMALTQIYILKEYRYKGFGRQIFEFIKDIVLKSDIRIIKTYPNKSDLELTQYFRNLGFEGSEEIYIYVGQDIYFETTELEYKL